MGSKRHGSSTSSPNSLISTCLIVSPSLISLLCKWIGYADDESVVVELDGVGNISSLILISLWLSVLMVISEVDLFNNDVLLFGETRVTDWLWRSVSSFFFGLRETSLFPKRMLDKERYWNACWKVLCLWCSFVKWGEGIVIMIIYTVQRSDERKETNKNFFATFF